jgi:hypothetical protein
MNNIIECVEKLILLVQWLITNLYVILYLATFHTIYVSVLILFMIRPQLIINTYVSLTYELKEIRKVFTSKFVGTGPSYYGEKKEFTEPRFHKVWETLLYTVQYMFMT